MPVEGRSLGIFWLGQAGFPLKTPRDSPIAVDPTIAIGAMNDGKTIQSRDASGSIKLAREIGNRQVAERLGINLDTLYTQLRRELLEKLEEIEILQDALGFFVKRRKK